MSTHAQKSPDHTMPVIEQFISLDGEGPTAGALSYFIRFAGCSLRCSWCDTAYSWDGSTPAMPQTPRALYDAVKARADLKAHGMKNRKYALIENGSWSPQAGALMEKTISEWKDMQKLGETVTVLSSVKEETRKQLEVLAAAIAEDYKN